MKVSDSALGLGSVTRRRARRRTVGVGLGVGEGVGLGVGEGVGLGVGLGVGDGVGLGVGEGAEIVTGVVITGGFDVELPPGMRAAAPTRFNSPIVMPVTESCTGVAESWIQLLSWATVGNDPNRDW